MTSNIENYGNSSLYSVQSAANTQRQNRLSWLFGRKEDTKDISGGVTYGQGSRSFSRLYTAEGTHVGTRLKEQLAKFDKRTPVQKVLDRVSKEAYADWKDTALYQKMSLVSQLYERREDESESAESALYRKEVSEASKPYPIKDKLTGNKTEKQADTQTANVFAKNISAKNDTGDRKQNPIYGSVGSDVNGLFF